jgi:hypothetical protein
MLNHLIKRYHIEGLISEVVVGGITHTHIKPRPSRTLYGTRININSDDVKPKRTGE